MRSLKALAREALDCQDASNLFALARHYAIAVLPNLREALEETLRRPCGTDDIARHPVTQLWVSKLHDLAGMGMSDGAAYGEAYKECLALADGLESPALPTEEEERKAVDEMNQREAEFIGPWPPPEEMVDNTGPAPAACSSDPGDGSVYSCNAHDCPAHGERNRQLDGRRS
jgi:hypothetical protein